MKSKKALKRNLEIKNKNGNNNVRDIFKNQFLMIFPSDLEKQFSKYNFKNSLIHVRISLIMGYIFYLLWFIYDFVMFPNEYLLIWMLRIIFGFPFIISLIFTYFRFFEQYWQLFLSLTLFFVNFGLFVMILNIDAEVWDLTYVGFIMCLMFGYSIMKLKFLNATIVGLLIFLCYIVTAKFFTPITFIILFNNCFFLFGANGIGIFGCYLLELAARKNFYSNYMLELKETEIEEMNSNLEEIVEERTEELRIREEQLYQAQKMESIGRLAGGIAHDFNNIMTSIMGFAEILQLKFPDNSTSEGNAVEIIIEESKKARDLISKLLGFARKGKFNPVTLDVKSLIKDSIEVTENVFQKKIEVIYDFEPNAQYVFGDRNQLSQLLTNIIINANDAMPQGGILTFSTKNIIIDEIFAKGVDNLNPGPYAQISIMDNGFGMPEEVKKHIFEPFFTTKEKGKGTGLGLAMVYGIIKNHNGHIKVYSFPDEGTVFTIFLPISYEELQNTPIKLDVIKGNSNILIIDDEMNVRKVIKSHLEELGHSVYLANGGNEGIKIYNQLSEKIDLILLDMIMPDKPGDEVFFEIIKENPKIKIIIISGFSKNQKVKNLLKAGAVDFLQKPFSIYELSKKVADVLNIID